MNKKYAHYLFAAIMAVSMGFIMSLALTFVNTGMDNGFFLRWIRAFITAICIAFPTALLIAPITQLIVNKAVKDK